MPKENQVSRRTFLKTTGVAGAGILAAGLGAGTLLRPRKAQAISHSAGMEYLPVPQGGIDVDTVRKRAWEHYFLSGGS